MSIENFPFSRSLPEEFQFLCMLHNVGATMPERSMTIEEIARWTGFDMEKIKAHLQRLMEMGYVQALKVENADKYHVTFNGIRKVLTLYS
jgi:predicted transcriptional regulator